MPWYYYYYYSTALLIILFQQECGVNTMSTEMEIASLFLFRRAGGGGWMVLRLLEWHGIQCVQISKSEYTHCSVVMLNMWIHAPPLYMLIPVT